MKTPPSPSESRAQAAARIAADPAGYKICEGCDSIVTAPTSICPNCHGFRFDGDSGRVTRQAKRLGRRKQRSVTSEDLG